ncbi:MAG: HD domain-containing protein [Pseudomonadota bacterium]
MAATRSVELNGKRIEITDAMRAAVREELPELAWIADDGLRAGVTDAWAAALASSSFARLSEMKPSGNYDSRPLRHGSQADHIRSVTRMALKIAEEMDQLMPDFRYDRDLLIAGCLCHDIGKVWEFDPANVERWKAAPRRAGMPSIRHPAYGVHICLTMGLPEAVAHMAGAHSGEGELLVRSLENTILHWADYTFWRVLEAGDQLADADDWLGGLTHGRAGETPKR